MLGFPVGNSRANAMELVKIRWFDKIDIDA